MTFQELDLSKKYTYADYLKWTFQERLELIKGKIYAMSPAPNRKHQETSQNLSRILGNFLLEKKCKVYAAPFDVRLTPRKKDKSGKIHTVVQPDICVICDLEKLDDAGCVGAPDLIIEILSPGNTKKEMKEKKEVYEENGVKEYWIVHPTDEYILQYNLENGKFVGGTHYFDDEIVISTAVEGFSTTVSKVLEE
ncbi:MAG: Uma2 family endonuclease [Spirosomaceae bacterium]|nr:Uma2 family endonuclease [Spirosomataceae bacterium]